MNKEIYHIAPIFQRTSGVSTFVGELANGQASIGDKVTIATLSQFVNEHYPVSESVNVVDVLKCLNLEEERPDIVHIHGIWTPVLHRIATLAVRIGIPLVWSPHGMLAPWAMRHKRWKKWPIWWLWQKRDLAKSSLIHATTDLEAEWIRNCGLRNDLVIVPLGTSMPKRLCDLKADKKVILFVGRLYPVKGLENLIRAWGMIEAGKRQEWVLRIVGPDQADYRGVLEKLVERLQLGESVEFTGPKYGEDLNREYDKCECLTLPSFTENFGATIVDALAHGKPCIASMFTPWKELQDRGCGWWVENEPETLSKAIMNMMNVGVEQRREMGERGRRLVEERYTWKAVVNVMERAYEGVMR